ncbi:MAG: AhpC/TSA family protein [Spirulinaceae cyanobacterium SM2_1_0]|nr:AhpC/TSA family protein [Spirulinaceae cyanobacterium SM2_1_0]
MNLSQQLAARQEQLVREVFSPAQAATLQADTAALKQTGIEQQSLQVGDAMPNFVLPTIAADPVELQQLLATGPVVISFYRGSWCTFCSAELKALDMALPAIAELGATLVSISPELPRRARRAALKTAPNHLLLHDRGNQLAEQLQITFTMPEPVREIYSDLGIDLVHFNGDDSHKLPVPATFIVAQDQSIQFCFVNADYTQRLDPVEIVTVLKRLQSPASTSLATAT